jgi:hypothetical protein
MQVQDGASPRLASLKGQQSHDQFFRLLGKKAVVAYRGEELKAKETGGRSVGTGSTAPIPRVCRTMGRASLGFQGEEGKFWKENLREIGKGGPGARGGGKQE